jgi:phosphonate transport system ATP-binding protein
LLQVQNLSKVYPNGHRALDSVSLGAAAGELTVILGANGSGKTTLVRCVVGLARPTSGSITIAGDDWSRLRGRRLRESRRRVGVIFQNVSVVPRRSALANVAVGCLGRQHSLLTHTGLFPRDEAQLALDCLERVGLANLAGQRADTLSGGQAQRVAIARALLQQPALLLADEPVASLDPDATADVMTLLRTLARSERLAVVCVLHQLDVAREYADRIVGLRRGSVVMDDRADRIDQERLAALYREEPGAAAA